MHLSILILGFTLICASSANFMRYTRPKPQSFATVTSGDSTNGTDSSMRNSTSKFSNSTSSMDSTTSPTNSTSAMNSTPSALPISNNIMSNSTDSNSSNSSNPTSSSKNNTSSPMNTKPTHSKNSSIVATVSVGIISISHNKTTIGYLFSDLFKGIHTVNSSKEAAIITLPSSNCSTLPEAFNIAFNSATNTTEFPTLGSVVLKGFEPTSPKSSGFVFTVDTLRYTAGSRPDKGNSSSGSNGLFESAIWSLNCTTKEISSNWISSSELNVPLTQISVPEAEGSEYLASVANFTSFNQTYQGTKAIPVIFTFIPSNITM